MKFTLDDAIEKVGDLAQTGIAKSAQVTEMAKLQINNATENENIKKQYMELGKTYYQQFGQFPEPRFQEACEKIKESRASIVKNNLRIKELRNDDIILTEEKMPDDLVDVEETSVTDDD